MHLVDHARAHIENTYKRPWHEPLIRETAGLGAALSKPLPPVALRGAVCQAFRADHEPHGRAVRRLGAMLSLAPTKVPARGPEPGASFAPEAEPAGRVALLSGCAQPVLNPGINQATIDLLTRKNIEVVLPSGEGCCGALVHHMGKEDKSLAARAAMSMPGCAKSRATGSTRSSSQPQAAARRSRTTAHMLRLDPAYAEKARTVSALACDITEYLERIDLGAPTQVSGLTLAYHSACSMQHGQKITTTPKTLLKAAGFTVKDVPQGHLCCGSAGTYNIMQPQIARQLRDNKVANIESTNPD
jgi:glycolate oxidase iron-sulfur subunit